MRELARLHPGARFLHCYRPHHLWRGFRSDRPANARCVPLFEGRQPWGADLYHGLNQRLPRRRRRSAVCTFHDLFVLTGEYSTKEFRARFAAQAREAAERADVIIAVSAFTASQVESLLGVEWSRIRVVPHGVRFPAVEQETPREPVVLHVGALQARKNVARLVAAFERAAPAPWRLVLAGSDGYGAEAIHERIARSPARDRILVAGWVGDAELRGWYRRAAILGFVSLDEGFGIPALEAMAQGLPVLSAKGSALEEVCGGAALLVDPRREDQIAEGLRQMVEDAGLRDRLRARGLARARRFTWEQAAHSTWRVYEELL